MPNEVAAQTQAPVAVESQIPASTTPPPPSPVQTPPAPINEPAPNPATITPATPHVPETEAVKATLNPEQKDAPPPQPPPTSYNLKLPEGTLLDASHQERIVAFSKAHGLSNTQAQAILDQESELLSTYTQGQTQRLRDKADEWITQIKQDQEIGGESFSTNVALANQVVHRFGSESFKETLRNSGLGNNPELVRFCARIGKLIEPDKLVVSGGAPPEHLSVEARLYPNHK